MNEKPVYIHYGDNKFKIINPIKNDSFWTKPHGGLWASRKEDAYGWKNWCKREEFRLDSFDQSFEFTLKDFAKILVLKDLDQLDILPKLNTSEKPYVKGDSFSACYLDFEKLTKEYDAIEVVDIEAFYFALYGWDCNSILIMNPDIVEVMQKEETA